MRHARGDRDVSAGTRRGQGIRPGFVVAVSLLLSACALAPPAKQVEAAPIAATAPSVWPIDGTLFRTTSAGIYLGNLDARIASLESRLAAGDAGRTEALAAQRYHRYKVRGRLEDADRALDLLATGHREGALSADGQLLYATMLSGLHRFPEAEAVLAAALAAGADANAARNLQADLDVALGRYDRLADDLAADARPSSDFYALAHRADLRVLQGDLAGAERLYLSAQTVYNDVNPVPLAWLHTQMGIAYLRFGRIEDARRFFAAAADRLPGYYLAEEHLAECEALLGDVDAARSRYLRVIAATGNPEFAAALSGLERDAGNVPLADALQALARSGYDDLLRRHPLAYAQHAAEFFIETGETAHAHALARENAALRSDFGSLVLLATAAHANGAVDEACAARGRALALGFAAPERAELDSMAEACEGP